MEDVPAIHGPSVELTLDERATLESWARSRTSARALTQRAQIVLACEQSGSDAETAERLGVSRQTVGKWRSRFLAEGLDGLMERPRSGRPRKADDDTVVQILVKLLAAPPGGRREWSTRSMASETDLSQATVNRIWSTHRLQERPGRTRPELRRAVMGSVRVRDVVGLLLAPPARILAVIADTRTTAPASTHRSRAGAAPAPASLAGRRAFEARNLLAVTNAFALLRGKTCSHRAPDTAREVGRFLADLDQCVAPSREVHLVIACEPDAVLHGLQSWVREHPRFHLHLVPAGSSWLDEIETILANNPLLSHESMPGLATSLAALRSELHAWAATWTPDAGAFTWSRLNKDSVEQKHGQRNPANADIRRAAGPDVHASASGDRQEVDLVRDALLTSPPPPGERVQEAPLASRLGISRRAVRGALRVLVEEGVLDQLPPHGASVPTVGVTSVLDMYAVRAALGTMVIRRAAMLERSELRPVKAALTEVRDVARRDHARIGESDLCFQDAIARRAGLPQASLIFQRLTMRLRMFISVLQLDFADAAADLIAREDAAIFEAIRSGDGDEAARLWRIKVERSARYMVTLLPQSHFDPNLWVTIAGKPAPYRH
ncbi:IS630 family transposase [Streptomyces sp. Da 82-17]|uniref:IS630 family transposase n=1 Tax=Streptomyces sp. Da 82-17 TaxID=3377116 RepID=UPI0038D492E4